MFFISLLYLVTILIYLRSRVPQTRYCNRTGLYVSVCLFVSLSSALLKTLWVDSHEIFGNEKSISSLLRCRCDTGRGSRKIFTVTRHIGIITRHLQSLGGVIACIVLTRVSELRICFRVYFTTFITKWLWMRCVVYECQTQRWRSRITRDCLVLLTASTRPTPRQQSRSTTTINSSSQPITA